MTYYEPGKEPLGNKECMRAFRLLFSNQRAAQLVRIIPIGILKYLIISFGFALLFERFIFLLPDHLFNLTLQYVNNENQLILFSILFLLLTGFFKFHIYLYKKWKKHIIYRHIDGNRFFWISDEEGNPPNNACGVIFNKKSKRWYSYPLLSQENCLSRGFNFTGLKLFDFIKTEYTVGIEYPLAAFWQIIQHYFGVERWNDSQLDRASYYQAVINTTLATYICTDKNNKYYGHCLLTNVMLPFKQNSTRTFERIVLFLDHDKQKVTKISMEYLDYSENIICEIWGSHNNKENTYQHLSSDIQMSVINQISYILVSLYSHGHTHLWANATSIIPNDIWPLAKKSSVITQWMNSQAVFLSWWFTGNTMEAMGTVLSYNNAQGLPFHSHGDIMMRIGEKSLIHQMNSAARKRISEYLNDKFGEENNLSYADAISSATILHSADHYYAVKFFGRDGKHGNCIPLQMDYTGVSLGLCSPISYKLSKLLVRHHLNDPICKILYEEAYKIDPEFADNALSIGCAY